MLWASKIHCCGASKIKFWGTKSKLLWASKVNFCGQYRYTAVGIKG